MKKPLKLAWSEKRKRMVKRLNQPIGKGRKPSVFALFLRQFSELLNAGIHSYEAVSLLKDQPELKSLRYSLEDLEQKLLSGMAMSDGISEDPHFTPFLTAMIRTGEKTGQLAKICSRLSEYYQAEHERKQKIRRALFYPAIVLVTMIIVLIFLFIYVLPTFVNLFEESGAKLPWNTVLMINITTFFRDYGWSIPVVLGLMAIVLFLLLQKKTTRLIFHRLQFYSPFFFRLRRELFTEKIASNLALILENGVPLLQGLDILIPGLDNSFQQKVMNEIKEDLIAGKSVAQAFHRDIFTPLLITMITVGERTGKLAEGFENTAKFYKKETAHSIEKALQLLEPVMILIMSVIVGFVVLSIATPMFDLVNQMEVY